MVMRTYGLSGSGIDVDQMVKDIMKARRASYDKLVQTKTQLEWKKADYNSIYTTISEFRTNTVLNYKLDNTLMPKKASSSQETVVTVTANAEAGNISHDINVLQLADGVKKISAASISEGSKDKLSSQFNLAPDTNYSFTIKNGGASADISFSSNDSIYDLVGKINSSNTGIKAAYDTTLDRFFMYTTGTGSSSGIEFSGADVNFVRDELKINLMATSKSSSTAITTGTTGGTLSAQFTGLNNPFTFKINGSADINVDPATETMTDLITKINTSGANVTASYDAALDRFTITSNDSGIAAGIDFSGSSAEGLAFFSDNLKINTTAYAENGKDAVINLDNIERIAQSSNTFTLTGVTYNLKATGVSKVTITSDNDKVVESIKSFISAYNATLAKINGELSETKYKDFLPLTDEQKAEMSDNEITAWEEKAKSGSLRNDTILRGIISSMRNDLSNPITGLTGKYNSAAAIGITTGSYSEGGKLYLDEAKLKKALEEDLDAVSKIFGTKGDAESEHSEHGIAVRLYDTLKASVDKITAEAGITASADYDTQSNLAKRIHDYEKRMYLLEQRLQDEEDRYYSQFDAMEAAISRLNQQSAWLTQQLSG